MAIVCKCGQKYSAVPAWPLHCSCGIITHEDGSQEERDSPRWIALLSPFRKPEDKGVGDTARRMFAVIGGEAFKKWAKEHGVPCGCTERQAAWNERWPY